MNARFFFNTAMAAAILACAPAIKAQTTLKADHPTAAVVNKYLVAIVEQDWTTAAGMIFPVSLESRQQKMSQALKSSPTMTEEAARLKLLGLKEISELEKLTPQEAYVADRKAVYSRMPIAPDVIKKKKESLKINILGLIPENDGKIVHAIVRTNQETNDTGISELLLISMIQDKTNTAKWFINPDMQQPIATPIGGAAPAPAPAAP
ncbi:hypothetical protein FEM03_22590 [Phragmitibacter flavus]|uniref:DUF4252 domain-containing protein n=1 Tax=Phragmitibacter flavus TaxID=2576071 RepID=A0A5R8K853_9BACT|nr:hypothetical protein [Phragmitibacter flavus]TLD68493.1 hypothetical protein FEM03_22590 [Phragmitibacter flavus]